MARRRRNQGHENSSIRRTTRKERPVQRNAANARERARMRVLSKAFSRLKTSLPWVPADTKLSKLDTLRLASSYISHLRKVLAEDDSQQGSFHPINFTWPFTFGSASSRSVDASSPAEDGEEDGDETGSNEASSFDPDPNNHYDLAAQNSYDDYARMNAYNNNPHHRNTTETY